MLITKVCAKRLPASPVPQPAVEFMELARRRYMSFSGGWIKGLRIAIKAFLWLKTFNPRPPTVT